MTDRPTPTRRRPAGARQPVAIATRLAIASASIVGGVGLIGTMAAAARSATDPAPAEPASIHRVVVVTPPATPSPVPVGEASPAVEGRSPAPVAAVPVTTAPPLPPPPPPTTAAPVTESGAS